MKKFMFAGAILFVSLMVYIGCKPDGPTNLPIPVTDLLTGGSIRKWGVVSETINGQPQTLDTCDTEFRLIFKKDGNKFVMDADTNCASDNYGVWALSNNDKSLTFNFQYSIDDSNNTTIDSNWVLYDIITVSDEQLGMKRVSGSDTIVSTYRVANQ